MCWGFWSACSFRGEFASMKNKQTSVQWGKIRPTSGKPWGFSDLDYTPIVSSTSKRIASCSNPSHWGSTSPFPRSQLQKVSKAPSYQTGPVSTCHLPRHAESKIIKSIYPVTYHFLNSYVCSALEYSDIKQRGGRGAGGHLPWPWVYLCRKMLTNEEYLQTGFRLKPFSEWSFRLDGWSPTSTCLSNSALPTKLLSKIESHC